MSSARLLVDPLGISGLYKLAIFVDTISTNYN